MRKAFSSADLIKNTNMSKVTRIFLHTQASELEIIQIRLNSLISKSQER